MLQLVSSHTEGISLMRLLVTLGALTISGALFAACGDDDPGSSSNGGSGGAGGSTAGTGGTATAGAAGAAGAAGDGGAAGAAGTGGSGTGGSGTGGSGTGGSGTGGTSSGTGGTSAEDPDAGDGDASTADGGDAGPPPCTGCVELRVDLDDNNQLAFFQTQFGSADLSGVTVTFSIRALSLSDQLTASPFATDGTTEGGSDFTLGNAFTQLNAGNGFDDTETFVDVALDIDALGVADAEFDPTDVIALGVQFGSAGAFGTDPATEVLLLDSVTFDGGPLDDITFTDDEEGFAFAGFGQPASFVHH
jgi:hypothetical protein